MKNGHLQKKHGVSGTKKPLSESKRLSHLSGIKVVKEGEIPDDIQANGEIYDLLILPTFTLCACYLGYANFKILEEEKVEIPVGLIWDLFNFTSGLTPGEQIIDRHMMMIEKAFDLLGFHADLSVKDKDIVVIDGISKIMDRESGKTKYIGFNEKGINPDIFLQMLMRALHKSS
ncbi:MAG: hypothetical protein JXA41_12805 [Deltaproteobacteria bacterium]|nr:hypothetical protein [Deltaproteobacteria bacterium]